MNEWISVDDRLPELGEIVLVVSMTSINNYGYPYEYREAVDLGFYSSASWWMENWDAERIGWPLGRREIEEYRLENITHWMPLPEPPK